MVSRLLDRSEGKLSTSKWAAMTKCSTDTALRDITELVEHNILQKSMAGGRSTHYVLLVAPSNAQEHGVKVDASQEKP